MDKNCDGQISEEELRPWVELLAKNGGIPKVDLTVRCWHLLAFRDIEPPELTKKLIREYDKNRDGKISISEFAKLSSKFEFAKVFDEMFERKPAQSLAKSAVS